LYRSITQAENKVGKPVLFFRPQKVSVNSPRLPHIPPQNHHKNTTSAHPFLPKTPAKTPFHHAQKKAPLICV
jgi:hypothetical protein